MLGLEPLQFSTLAAALSLLIIPLMWRVAPRLGLVDLPDPRKVHTSPVPRVGGWGITIGTVLPMLLWLKFDPLLISFLVGICVLFLFGVWDDARSIGHWTKFTGQFVAAGVVVYYGDLYISRVPFLDIDPLNPAIGKPLSMFALIGAINAINHSDGLDGLAAGESILSLIGFAILGYLGGSAIVLGIALALIGGILGFLRYNSYPARVFMGDAGSQVLGFALGFIAIFLTQRVDTALSAAVPLLLLGVPIADIVAVLWQRIRAGENWFKASRNHIHHRLLDVGFAHYQTVIIIYSVHALLVCAAVLLRYQSDFRVFATYASSMLCLFGGLWVIEHSGWRPKDQRHISIDSSRPLESLPAVRWLRIFSRRLIWISAPALMLLGSLWAARIPRDVGLIAALLAVVLAVELSFARAVRAQVVRATVYVAAIASAYLAVNYPGIVAQQSVEIAAVAVIGALVAAIGAYIRLATDKKFDTTPTDYLIAFTVVALMIFAGIDASSRSLVEIIVYAVVLLYGCEVLIGGGARRWNGFTVASLATLSIMAIRGLL